MSTVQASPTEIAAIWPTLNGGDTLELIGEFVDWRPGKRTFADKRLVIDASQAVLRGLYGAALDGVDWNGGIIRTGTTYKLGLRLDRVKNLSISGVTLDDDQLVGNGIMIYHGETVVLDGVRGTGFLDAVVLTQISGGSLSNFDLAGFAADGVDIYNVENFVCQDGKIHDNTHVSAKHADGVQLANANNGTADCIRTTNVTVQRVSVVGNGGLQGVTAFNHPENATPDFRYAAITFRDLDILVDSPQACALYGCDGGLIENVAVRTVDGAKYRASLNVGDCTGIERWNNTVGAGAGKPAMSDPPRPAPVPTPAELLAVIEADEDKLAADTAALKAALGGGAA